VTLKTLVKNTHKKLLFLGHRGKGKTAWLKDRYPNAVWIDFLLPIAVSQKSQSPV
jgi:hypothetical protein